MVLVLILVLVLLVVLTAAAVLLFVLEHLLGVGQVGLGLHVAGVAAQGVLVQVDGFLPGALFQFGGAGVVVGVGAVLAFGERVEPGLVAAVGFGIVLQPEAGVAQVVIGRHRRGVGHQGFLIVDFGLRPVFLPEVAVAAAHAGPFALGEADRRGKQAGQDKEEESFHII